MACKNAILQRISTCSACVVDAAMADSGKHHATAAAVRNRVELVGEVAGWPNSVLCADPGS